LLADARVIKPDTVAAKHIDVGPHGWEPNTVDPRSRNIAENPMAALLYVASSCVCTPNSLSQEVGAALDAQAGEGRLRAIFEEAGFRHFRRAAQTPMNLIIEAGE
jgi:hypothetical protein